MTRPSPHHVPIAAPLDGATSAADEHASKPPGLLLSTTCFQPVSFSLISLTSTFNATLRAPQNAPVLEISRDGRTNHGPTARQPFRC
jgi:hypothetical protein